MQRSNTTTTATIIILAVSGLLIVGAALFGTTETISYDVAENFEFVPADHEPGTAIVVSKKVEQGTTLFWIVLREDEHGVTVTFTAGEECLAALPDLDAWPPADSPCTGPPGVSGPLAGSGRTTEGEALISVTIPVTEACFAAIELGTPWSSAPASCG